MKKPMDRQLEKRLSDRAVAIGRDGDMAGRRLAVGFLQLVPGVFPTGAVTPMKPAAAKGCVLSIAVDCYRLLSIAIDYSYETRCRKGRRQLRSNGWTATGHGFSANCPRCFLRRGGY